MAVTGRTFANSTRRGLVTRTTNSRIAGFAFLFYIAVGVTQMVLGGAISAPGTAARLALMAQRPSRVQVEILLTLLTSMTALTLAVAVGTQSPPPRSLPSAARSSPGSFSADG